MNLFKILLNLCVVLGFVISNNYAKAQNVLILHDEDEVRPSTLALKNYLIERGANVDISPEIEYNWDNTNPSLENYGAVIHLNSNSYSTDMPIDGQNALVDYVENRKGLYVGFEWNSYQYFNENGIQNLNNLILFNYSNYLYEDTVSLVINDAQINHPVLEGVPASLDIIWDHNIGTIREFENYPSTVLMTEGENDALAIRQLKSGYVLNFHLAPNYYLNDFLNPEINNIIANFVNAYAQLPNIVEECTSKGLTQNFEWIQQVKLGSDINNITLNGNAGYGDFSSSILSTNSGEQIAIELTPGYKSRSYKEYWKIWIDRNNDGDFSDLDETVFSLNGKGKIEGNLTIPNNLSPGLYKVRVSMRFNKNPKSCGNFTNGEVREYTIQVGDNLPD